MKKNISFVSFSVTSISISIVRTFAEDVFSCFICFTELGTLLFLLINLGALAVLSRSVSLVDFGCADRDSTQSFMRRRQSCAFLCTYSTAGGGDALLLLLRHTIPLSLPAEFPILPQTGRRRLGGGQEKRNSAWLVCCLCAAIHSIGIDKRHPTQFAIFHHQSP